MKIETTNKTIKVQGEELHLAAGHLDMLKGALVKTTHITLFDDQGWGSTLIIPTELVEGFIEDEERVNAFIQKARFALGLPATCTNTLTLREIHILKALRGGITNQDLADEFFVCEHTIKTHLYRIYKKINVKKRIQAIEWARLNLQAA